MSLRRGTLEVRSRGGALSSKVHSLYVVLTNDSLIYFNKKEDLKKKGTPADTVKLSDISDVQAVKSKTGGFTFEVKTAQVRTQHVTKTDEERQKWIYILMKAKTDSEGLKEAESSEGETTPRLEKTSSLEKSSGSPLISSSSSEPTTADTDYSGGGTVVITGKAGNGDMPEYMKQFAADKRKEREEFFGKLSKEELKGWLDVKLLEYYQGAEEKLLQKWREEKSTVMDAMLAREVEAIENSFQQRQLDLEKDFQEKRGQALK